MKSKDMDFTKKVRLGEVLNAVTAMNALYDAQKIMETTSADMIKKIDPGISALLREHEETAYKMRQRIINEITSMPEFRASAVN